MIDQSRRKGRTNSKQAADNSQSASAPTITLRASNEANLRYSKLFAIFGLDKFYTLIFPI